MSKYVYFEIDMFEIVYSCGGCVFLKGSSRFCLAAIRRPGGHRVKLLKDIVESAVISARLTSCF